MEALASKVTEVMLTISHRLAKFNMQRYFALAMETQHSAMGFVVLKTKEM